MNFQTMEYLIAVARERSISRAAESLHFTQQTLSAHLASVERELGCKLFVRHVPLEITYEGEEFLKYAQAIQKDLEAMRAAFAEIAGEEKGLLRIGITDNRDRIVLAPLVLSFLEEHPKVQIKVVEVPVRKLIQKLLKDELDICISNYEESHHGIHACDLYQERVVFSIHRDLLAEIYGDDALSVMRIMQEDANYAPLEKCPLLLGHEQDIAGEFSREVIRSFANPPIIKVEAENMAFILDLCAQGAGGCFCPEILVRNTLSPSQQRNLVIMSLGEQASYTMRMVWKGELNIIKSFVELARKRLHPENRMQPFASIV